MIKKILKVKLTLAIISAFVFGLFINTNQLSIKGEVRPGLESAVGQSLGIFNYYHSDGERILLTIDSPGGSGTTMVKVLKEIRKSAVPVDTYAPGTIASAGSVIFMAGDKRYVEPETVVLFHGGHYGTYALTEVTLKNCLDQLRNGRIKDIMLGRANGQPVPKDLTLDEVKALEVASMFLQSEGLSGIEHAVQSAYENMHITNALMVRLVTEVVNKAGLKLTEAEVKNQFFKDFKEDVYFTGKQLVDMGIASYYTK